MHTSRMHVAFLQSFMHGSPLASRSSSTVCFGSDSHGRLEMEKDPEVNVPRIRLWLFWVDSLS